MLRTWELTKGGKMTRRGKIHSELLFLFEEGLREMLQEKKSSNGRRPPRVLEPPFRRGQDR